MIDLNWLSRLSAWLQTDGRADMLYVILAFALLGELSIRVVRQFMADRRARNDAAQNNLRISARLRRGPLV
jgi:hypothetical protein